MVPRICGLKVMNHKSHKPDEYRKLEWLTHVILNSLIILNCNSKKVCRCRPFFWTVFLQALLYSGIIQDIKKISIVLFRLGFFKGPRLSIICTTFKTHCFWVMPRQQYFFNLELEEACARRGLVREESGNLCNWQIMWTAASSNEQSLFKDCPGKRK